MSPTKGANTTMIDMHPATLTDYLHTSTTQRLPKVDLRKWILTAGVSMTLV